MSAHTPRRTATSRTESRRCDNSTAALHVAFMVFSTLMTVAPMVESRPATMVNFVQFFMKLDKIAAKHQAICGCLQQTRQDDHLRDGLE